MTLLSQDEIALPVGLPAFLDAMIDVVVVIDAAGRVQHVNAAWRRFCAENGGDTESQYIGTNYFEICQSGITASDAAAGAVARGVRETLKSGTPYRSEYPCHAPGKKRWFELYSFRLIGEGGEPYAVIQHRDITTRYVSQSDAREAIRDAEILSALVASSRDAILSHDLSGAILTWNHAAEELFGLAAEEVLGQSVRMLYPEEWEQSMGRYRDDVLSGELTDFEAEMRGRDGRRLDLWVTASPIRGQDGDVVAISNILRDVTEMRAEEEAREAEAREVIHRAKNMLTVVNAIHRQTARKAESMAEFADIFGARLQSLVTSTDVLVQGRWQAASLRSLAVSQLRPFVSDLSRVHLLGPEVSVDVTAAQVLGMALHELATNASKYGGLAQPAGEITLSWELVAEEGGTLLQVNWAETGIEIPAPPTSHGFGTDVLTKLAASMLGAEPVYALEADRVSWQLAIAPEFYTLD